MKRSYSIYLFSALKIPIFIGCMIYGCLANAQSIVGKWKMIEAKETVKDPSGHKQDLSAAMSEITKMMEQAIEFREDHTYFMQNKMINAKSGIEVNGKYAVTGDQLRLQPGKGNIREPRSSAAVNYRLPNLVTILSIKAETLVLTYGATITDDGKTFTVNIVDTFLKQ